MDKKSFAVFSIAVIVVGAGFVLYLLTSKAPEKKAAQPSVVKVTIVNIDDVVRYPGKFSGIIGVEGLVTEVDATKSSFVLGCEDGDAMMPIRFVGHLPKEGINVVAYGEIRKTEDAKCVFVAQEIKTK